MYNLWRFSTSSQFILPLAFFLGGLLVGILLERFSFFVMRRISGRTDWDGYRTVRNALRGMITLWGAIAGLYLAIRFIDLSPNIVSLYHKGLLVLIVFSITLVTARISAGLVDLYIRKAEGALPSTTILGNMLRIVIVLTGILVILTLLDVPITPIITALGIGGFAVALAFQDTLSNLFSGLHILASRLIRPGDYVRLDTGEEGYAVDVTWRNTTIRTLPNNMVVIPNSRLASAIITNYNQPEREMAVLVDLGVDYASDLEQVERVTIETAREVLRGVSGGVSSFEPFIRFHTFGDNRIDFTVILRVEEYVDQYLLKHEFVKRVHRRFQAEGIEIPFPTRRMYLSGDREEFLSHL